MLLACSYTGLPLLPEHVLEMAQPHPAPRGSLPRPLEVKPYKAPLPCFESGHWIRNLMTANTLLALGAANFSAIAGLLIRPDRVPSIRGMVIAFATVLATYNYDRIKDMDVDDPESTPTRSEMLKKRNAVVRAGIVASAVAVLLLSWSKGGLLGVLWGFSLLFAGLFYTMRVPCTGFRLKDLPAMKNFYIPFSWCTLVPQGAYFNDISLSDGPAVLAVACFTVIVFVIIFLSALTSDYRDHREDTERGVKTLVVVIGPENTLTLMDIGPYALSAFIIFVSTYLDWLPPASMAWIPMIFFGYWCFLRAVADASPAGKELWIEIYDYELVLMALVFGVVNTLLA